MYVAKVKRVSNPQRKRRVSKAWRNPKRKRLTAKQIKFFGTSRQRAALKRRKSSKNPTSRRRTVRRVARKKSSSRPNIRVVVNPVIKTTRKRRKATAKRRRRSNPSLVALGFVNPERTKKRMAKRRRRSLNPRRRRARKNPTRVVVYRTRRRRRLSANPRRRRRSMNPRRRRMNPRRRNPALFGHQISPVEMAKAVVGGLVGVTITKTVPTFLPASLTSNPFINVVISAITAWGSGHLTKSIMPDIADAVAFGGYMQAGSVLLNAFIPSIGSTIGLSGMGGRRGVGYYAPASFPVPQNPIQAAQIQAAAMAAASAPPAQMKSASGMGRAFPGAF